MRVKAVILFIINYINLFCTHTKIFSAVQNLTVHMKMR